MNDKNTIPPMTHPLSRAWDQPSTEGIILDDKYALMTQEDFKKLLEYSCSTPTGVYDGKMWKGDASFGTKKASRWFLMWFGPSKDPNMCQTNSREIILV